MISLIIAINCFLLYVEISTLSGELETGMVQQAGNDNLAYSYISQSVLTDMMYTTE